MIKWLIDPCHNHLCLNDGTCERDGVGGYICNCSSTGYNGEMCHIAGKNG